jgi:CRISPR-associated endonuclease/helicase Cas3
MFSSILNEVILGIVQNARLPLFNVPAMIGAAFVFDEIHLYDDRLFSALLHFVQIFRNAPILLMTASLPQARLGAIRCVLEGRGEALGVVEGDPDIESRERYRFVGLTHEPGEAVHKILNEGGKVLWVTNTVRSCVSSFRQLQMEDLAPLPYHSRYRYIDRLGHHSRVIDAFRVPGPALAVTTQVCEVSLDLSADLLVSELAPVPALIQRLGRLNRRTEAHQRAGLRDALFLQPETEKPYEKADLDQARTWIESLQDRPLCQRDLASSFEALSGGTSPPEVTPAWTEGLLFSPQLPLRDAGTTVPIVRYEDIPECNYHSGRADRLAVLRNAIPMPLWTVAREVYGWPRDAGAFFAPAGRVNYDPLLGGSWRERGK